ncbi:recombinase family protein [Endozoicomonas sp. Mp262]|uniref:recombinase family protein n=1 Tax=Endozoicomonas sp. Mp262 TaxID=2919499 RepID=UPI0021DAD66B
MKNKKNDEPVIVKKRCAIYTRKSSEEGLEQSFNSLHAQREAAEAYIHSQRHEGWEVLTDQYDDGAFSGGNTDRPALKRLLADVEEGRIDVVVVYKVDRLSRSLADFARLIELFEQHNCSLVSVTQQFNTTSSMGRLTLNILLSFAQFEREVTSERIRDKVQLSKAKGMWMGGNPALGYDIKERKLIINREEARIIKALFKQFVKTQSIISTVEWLNKKGYRTKTIILRDGSLRGNIPFSKGAVHRILHNRLYIGEIGNRGRWYQGEHKAIIPTELWQQAQDTFDVHASIRSRSSFARANPAFLKGLITGPNGKALSTNTTRKRGQQFRYYVSQTAQQYGAQQSPLPPLSASTLEGMVVNDTQKRLVSPELLFNVCQRVQKQLPDTTEDEIRSALNNLGEIWGELFAPEKRRLTELLIARVEVTQESLTLYYQPDGMQAVVKELQGA